MSSLFILSLVFGFSTEFLGNLWQATLQLILGFLVAGIWKFVRERNWRVIPFAFALLIEHMLPFFPGYKLSWMIAFDAGFIDTTFCMWLFHQNEEGQRKPSILFFLLAIVWFIATQFVQIYWNTFGFVRGEMRITDFLIPALLSMISVMLWHKFKKWREEEKEWD